MPTQLPADRLALPPPPDLNLLDGEQRVGWILGDAVGFRGFADETEAAHAAWVSYRALARRLARTHGTRPVPIDIEPLALQRRGDEELILASGRPIATLVRPGAESPSGVESFGFEIRVPAPADELRVRSMGHLMYRTLRKSGLRWAMWRPAPTPGTVAAARPESGPPEAGKAHAVPRTRVSGTPSPTTFVASVVLAAIAIVVAATLLLTAPQVVTVPILFVLAVGFLVSCVLVTGDGWLLRRFVRGSSPHPAPARRRSDGTAPARPTRERWGELRTGAATWQALATIAAVSVALLLLALAAPERLGVLMAATGMLGLVGLRLSATFGGWGQHPARRANPRAGQRRRPRLARNGLVGIGEGPVGPSLSLDAPSR